MTALPALSANIALHIGVTMGLVTGQTAATTPMGFATNTRFASSSSPMMPRDFLPLRLFQITRALLLALRTLSSYTPRPVSLCAAAAMASALSYTYFPKSRTMASTCSWENVSYAAWATRALATSSWTSVGLVELDLLRPPATANSAVGLTIIPDPPY